MSRFVIATDGSRVNLDRLLSIRLEEIPRPAPRVVDRVRLPEPARARIYGVVSAEDRSLDVELCQGLTEAVSRIWERWETFTRDGMRLGRAVELEEAKILGIDPGELAAGLATVPGPVRYGAGLGSRGYIDQTDQPTEENR